MNQGFPNLPSGAWPVKVTDGQNYQPVGDAPSRAIYTQPAAPAYSTFYGYSGLSTTAKPTTAPDGSALPDGSTFTETDTGNRWTWAAATSTWYPQGFQGQIADLYRALKDSMELQARSLALVWKELRAIRNNTAIPVGKAELPEDAIPIETPSI